MFWIRPAGFELIRKSAFTGFGYKYSGYVRNWHNLFMKNIKTVATVLLVTVAAVLAFGYAMGET